MKTLLILLLLVTPVYSQTDTTANPCKDRVYIALQKKNIDSLSQREFDYYILKSKECSEYTALLKQLKTKKEIETTPGNGAAIVGIIFGGLIILGIINLANKK